MKVPSTSGPEILIWANARTEEVENCRQIAAVNTVILKEHQNNETSGSSGTGCVRCHIDSQGKP